MAKFVPELWTCKDAPTTIQLFRSVMAQSRESESAKWQVRLIQAALQGDAREGITNLLKEIATITESFGCVLWRATEGAEPPDKGELTMLAGWFNADNSFLGINRIPFRGRVTGAAAEHGWGLDNDLSGHKNPSSNEPFLKQHEMNKAAACRFEFMSGRLGVVTLFRQKGDLAFEEETDIRLLQEISEVLPFLYNGSRQKASYGLLKEVGKILREARNVSKPGKTTSAKMRMEVLRNVGAVVTKTFHSIEASIFLDDETKRGRFACAFTSEGPHAEMVLKTTYEPTLDGGFSALCLYAREAVRVHDTQEPQPELEYWQGKQPEFRDVQTPELPVLVKEHLGNPNPPPPFSLMVVPLISDGEMLGFLRCWVARTGPSYYSSDDSELLQLVADYLSQTLAAWRQEYRTLERRRRDAEAFKDLTKAGYTIGKKEGERDIFVAALGMVVRLMPEATFNTIRLRRADPDELYYRAYTGLPQPGTSSQELAKRLSALTLRLPGDSLAGEVIQKGQVMSFSGSELGRHPSDACSDMKEIVIAPIIVNGQVEGVLDLRASSDDGLPDQATALAGAVSNLLALHLALQAAEDEKRRAAEERMQADSEANRERAEREKAMRDAFEDVAHQIKSPLAEASRRLEDSMNRFQQGGAVRQHLEAMAALLGRAELNAKLIGLFASLAKGGRLSVRGTAHTPVDLVRMAGQICENQRPRISVKRNIRIQLDADSFYKHAPAELSADSELLPQALNNLVDNAVKYSYSNTVIEVFGAPLKRGGFYVGVINKGIPITPNEVHLVRQRNWRGEAASAHVGEGNGLGLWIVDNIMKAHGGELQVLPTRAGDGITEVRLAFPSAS